VQKPVKRVVAEGDNLKKIISGVLLGLLFVALVAIPVLASYYANLTATEANGNDYDQLGMQFSLDVDYLVDNGYITATGLDTRVTSGGTTLPHMMVDDRVLFVSDLEAYGAVNLLFETGNTALSSYPVVVGDGGYVTIADNANLELTDDFEIELTNAYIDTSSNLALVDKSASMMVRSDDGGTVDAIIYDSQDSLTQTTTDLNLALYSGSYTRAGQRLDSFVRGLVTQISFRLAKTGNPTGTAYCRIRQVSDDSIVGTVGSIDVTTLGAAAWVDFTTTSVFNPAAQDLRFTIEYDEGDAGNYIRADYNRADSCTGQWTRYDGSWAEIDDDALIKIYWYPVDVEVSATVASGEMDVTVWADTTDLGIDIDGSTEDTTALAGASCSDNANSFIISNIPYYSSYTHTTSSTLRLTYEPDAIIVGTTLPNEENPGTYDGAITFGSNPAGVTLALGGLVSEEQLLPGGGAAEFPETQEIAGETGQPGYTAGLATLPTHPLYPLVSVISAQTGIPIGIVWILGASFILAGLFVWMIGTHSMMHQMFIGLVGGGWVAFCWHQGIYPFWVIFIYAVLVIAIVIGERSPTIS